MKRTPTLTFFHRRHRAASRALGAHRGDALDATRPRRRMSTGRAPTTRASRSSTRCATATRFVLAHARAPRRRRARLAGRRCTRILTRAGQGLGDVHRRRRVPAALRVPLVRARRACSSTLPDDLAERTIVFLDCGNIDRNPVEAFQRDDGATSSTSTTTTTTRASATVNLVVEDASCTAEIVWDLMRALGVAADAGDRRGALRRAVTDTGRSCTRTPAPSAHLMAAELIAAGVDVTRRSTAASTRACP